MFDMCMESYRELMSAGTVRGMKEDPTQMMVSVVQVHPEGHLNTRFAPEQLTLQERNRKRSRQWCTGGLRDALLMLEAEGLSESHTHKCSTAGARSSHTSMTEAFLFFVFFLLKCACVKDGVWRCFSTASNLPLSSHSNLRLGIRLGLGAQI